MGALFSKIDSGEAIPYIGSVLRSRTPLIQKPRINKEITAPKLRVIGADGTNLGILARDEALALVRPEEGIDLIEIAAAAAPPVARLMSYDKYRYEREKAVKKERRAERAVGAKRVQVSARAAHHDALVKLKKLEQFLNEGHQVEVFLRLRGREKGMKQWAEGKLRDFMKMVTVEYKTITPPKFGGNGLITQVTKK